MNVLSRGRGRVLAGLVLGAGIATAAFAADTVSGSLNYKGRSVTFKYAWLVTGPSDFEAGKTVRRLVLSGTDIGTKLQACKTFSCTDGEVMEGATVDFTGGPKLAAEFDVTALKEFKVAR